MIRFRCRPELVALVVALAGCQKIDLGQFDLPGLDDGQTKKKPPPPVEIDDEDPKKPVAVPGKGTIDLGTAIYPDGTPTKGTILWSFSVPPMHRVGYRLADDEATAIDAFYAKYAKSVSYKRTGDKAFQWMPPKGCEADMSCVYKQLIGRSEADIAVVTARFKARAKAAKLSSVQLAETMLAFVQQIPYKIPTEDPFGLRPPPLVISKKSGDCDSKSLLFFMMLTQAGIDAVIVSSKAHAHTMVGVALPVAGSTFRYKDRKFAFAETTAKDAPLGWLPPDVSSPKDWRVELAN
ncbi:MAG: hypothetical protein ACXVEE_39090 [Polyangiales bacterium]